MSTIRILFLLALLSPALALAQAGRFLVAVGEVVVIRGPATIPATGGTPVHSGDTIRVGPSSNAQIRMSDESIVGLRPGTLFRIDEYAYSGQVDGSEKSLFSLLKGGMRTITGAIGRLHNRDKYAVSTPTATVGIRGTHFILVHCDNDCFEPTKVSLAQSELAQSDTPKPGIGTPVPNGTYFGNFDGTIVVVNNTPEQEFGPNTFGFVGSRDSAPQLLIAPPLVLSLNALGGQTRNAGRQGRESTTSGGANADGRSGPREQFVTQMYERLLRRHATNEETDRSGNPKNLCTSGQTSIQCASQTTGQQPPMVSGPGYHASFAYGSTTVAPNEGSAGLASATFNNNVLTQYGPDFFFNTFNLASATPQEGNFVGGVVAWRRFTGPVSGSGVAMGGLPGSFGTNEGFHTVVGLPPTPMPASGLGNFTMLGATRPTGSGGDLTSGNVTLSGTINVNFGLTTFAISGVTVSLTGPSGPFSYPNMSGSASITGAKFSGTISGASTGITGSYCSGPSCTAFLNGAFFGPNASHMGIAYLISGTQSIVGVFVLQQISDRRLKSNIKRIGTHPLGIGIYEYDIFGRHEVGVMAQEVETVLPEAVVTLPSGFKAVNYTMLNSY